MILNIYTQSLSKVTQPPQADLPQLDSTTFSPIFENFKMEFRAPHFDPTSIVYISIETVDKVSEEVRTVGYCAMNLFMSAKSLLAPTSEADNVKQVLLKN